MTSPTGHNLRTRRLFLFTTKDDIAFKKKQMHSGRWGPSRETISLLYLRHDHFSCGIFFCLIPLQYHNELQKSQMRYRLLENDYKSEKYILYISIF